MARSRSMILLLAGSVALAACGGRARLEVAQGTGPHPVLPAPEKALIPTIQVSPAIGWPAGALWVWIIRAG